jgi:hypothetical protein
MYHTSFIRIAQKVNSAEFINNKSILERMPFLLAAVIQFSVDFITWTMNGTFYAVMDKRGGQSRRWRRFLPQSPRQFVGSARRKEMLP